MKVHVYTVRVEVVSIYLIASEEVGLLHDAHELVLANLAVAVSVGLVDHLLDLVVGHVLAELLGHPLEVLEGDFAGLIVVEESEGFQHLLAGVTLGHFLGHHVQKFWEVDHATAVAVGIGDHFSDFLFLWLEAQSPHCNLKLLGVDGPTAVSVEEIKGLLDFLFLLLGQLRSLLWSGERSLFVA